LRSGDNENAFQVAVAGRRGVVPKFLLTKADVDGKELLRFPRNKQSRTRE